MARRSARGFLIVAAVAVLGAGVMCRSRSPHAASPAPAVVSAPERVAPPPPTSIDLVNDVPHAATDTPEVFAADLVLDTKARYLEGAIYPPWSAPATTAWQPFVRWNQPREHTDDDLAVDATGQHVQAAVQLDKLYARPGEALTATVVLWRGDRNAQQTAIDFTADARLQVWDQVTFDDEKWDDHNLTPGYTSVAEVELHAVPGQLNTLRGRFVPSKIDSLADGVESVRFIAAIHVKGKNGATIKPLELEFQYTAREPLVILDKVGDHIDDDGALVVDFEADVRVATGIKIESTLFDAAQETPIAVYQDFLHPTSTGKQQISVKFFGKAVREMGIAGPYTLQVHGFSTDLTRTPADVPWRDDRVFTTAAYALDDLSDQEWQDPQKDDMIQAYDRIAGEFQAQP